MRAHLNKSAINIILITLNSIVLMSCNPKDKGIAKETLDFVQRENLDIKGMEHPSGDIYSLSEAFKKHPAFAEFIQELVFDSKDLIHQEKLEHTLYILNSTGPTRDDYGVGYRYPADEKMEMHLNKISKAKKVIEWANNLPPAQREEYLERWRNNGWEGYL